VPGSQTVPGLLVRTLLQQSRVEADILDISNAFVAIALLRRGVGVAVSDPLLMCSEQAAGLIVRPFEPSIPLMMTMLFSRSRPLSDAPQAFAGHVRRAASVDAEKLVALGIQARIP